MSTTLSKQAVKLFKQGKYDECKEFIRTTELPKAYRRSQFITDFEAVCMIYIKTLRDFDDEDKQELIDELKLITR